MAGITLQQAQEQLDAALDNLARVRKVQETQVTGTSGGRKTVLPALQSALDEVQFWDKRVQVLSRGGVRFLRAVPLG